jgi:spore coat polysaccharide biosynthesis protein SpsF (cytidylyltransferase family)
MTIPPLAIVQARMGSTRLPGKMLKLVGRETMVARAWRLSCEAFGEENCVVAYPNTDENLALAAELYRIGARRFAWDGDEADVLARFYACATLFRSDRDSVVVRITPDDPLKRPALMRRVAAGERLPVELSAEAFTLRMLEEAHFRETDSVKREHISYAMYPVGPPPAPAGTWTVDTESDLAAVQARVRFEDGFWALVARGDGCWEWTGHTVKGYGTYSRFKAHRLAWELANGRSPGRMSVCHSCDNPGCVNPSHLWLGTARDNCADKVRKGRQATGEAHGKAKLTASEVADIRLNPANLSHRQLAENYGVTRGAIGKILRGQSWMAA